MGLLQLVRDVRQLFVDEDNLYWLGASASGSATQVYIWKCATAGCSLSPTTVGDYTAPGSLVGNATHLFRYDPTGSLYKYPIGSTTPSFLTGLYLPGSFGFAVDATTLPANVRVTHVSLFDGSLQGIARTDRPAFSFQGHPEASPGPHDISYLFDRFVKMMERK